MPAISIGQIDGCFATFQATAVAIAANKRVKIDSAGLVSVAGIAEKGIGITQKACAASGYVVVKLWGANGTYVVTVTGTIAAADVLYTAAAGNFAASASTAFMVGQALTGGATGTQVVMVLIPTGAVVP